MNILSSPRHTFVLENNNFHKPFYKIVSRNTFHTKTSLKEL